jgi:hypothetical protein
MTEMPDPLNSVCRNGVCLKIIAMPMLRLAKGTHLICTAASFQNKEQRAFAQLPGYLQD